jgi:hypothetical protein
VKTVLSHIVETRLSQEYENVATDALAFILKRNEAARQGLMNLLHVILPDLPELQFRTQHSVENVRPDMWGFDGGSPRVFIENKFWAGLTENQPVKYLQHLADYEQPSLLLMVAPEARQDTIWHELTGRLQKAGIDAEDRPTSNKEIRSVDTGDGRFMALTSWKAMLSYIEVELEGGSDARNDLNQVRALCGAADVHAFSPFAAEDLSDQRIPAFVLQMETLVRDSVKLAVEEGVLNIEGVKPSESWERLGRYAKIPTSKEYGVWFGLHFKLWREHGISPLWLFFSLGWGRALDAERILHPWCRSHHIFGVAESEDYAVAIDMAVGEEKEVVLRGIVDQLKAIYDVLQSAESEHE